MWRKNCVHTCFIEKTNWLYLCGFDGLVCKIPLLSSEQVSRCTKRRLDYKVNLGKIEKTQWYKIFVKIITFESKTLCTSKDWEKKSVLKKNVKLEAELWARGGSCGSVSVQFSARGRVDKTTSRPLAGLKTKRNLLPL